MFVEEMNSSDYSLFVHALNKEIPLSSNYKVFNTIDNEFHKIICFYTNPQDVHPIAILKIGNARCEFSDEFSYLDSVLASDILKSYLSNHSTNSGLSI